MTFREIGNDVVGTGSGSVNTAGLTLGGGTMTDSNPGFVTASIGTARLGPVAAISGYEGLPSTLSFGPGTFHGATSGSGDVFEMVGGTGGILKLFVPVGYVSGSPLSSTSTWENASFASLGLTPGTYLKPFGSGANADSVVVVVAVPEPATLGIVGMAALTLVRRRRLWGEKKG